MKKKDFNSLFITLGKEKLSQHGFIQKGNKFYRQDGNKLICFLKDSFKGEFIGIYVGVKFLKATEKLDVNPHSSGYEQSIMIENLKQESIAFKTPLKYKYDLQFYSREFGPSLEESHNYTTNLDLIKWHDVQEDLETGRKYIEQSLDIMLKEGLTFIELMTPEVSYQILMNNDNLETSAKELIQQKYNKLIDMESLKETKTWISKIFK